MERERYEHELLEYVEGRLDPDREAALRATLRHDPEMRARVEGMRKDREQLMREPTEERAPANGVERAITQAERDALVAARPARRAGHSWKVKVGALAAMVALAGVMSWWAWDYAYKSAQYEEVEIELPYGGENLSPQDEWVDPLGKQPLGEGLASSIEDLVDDPSQGGLASELEYAKPIAEAVELSEGAKPAPISFEDLAGVDPSLELTGPEYEPAIAEEELARAVELARDGRLRVVVDLGMEWEAEEAAWESLADAVGWETVIAERVEPWGPGVAGADLADEGLVGDSRISDEPGDTEIEQVVIEQEGEDRFVIDTDDLTDEEIAEAVMALAQRSRELGGVMGVRERVIDGGAGDGAPDTGVGEAEEKREIEVVVRWDGC